MGLARIYLITLTALAAVQATSVSKHLSDCDKLSSGYGVFDTTAFSPGTLNSSGVVNTLTLCRVQGTISYDKDDTPVSNGTNSLTWNLYLPILSGYNGRFIAVGKNDLAIHVSNTPQWLIH